MLFIIIFMFIFVHSSQNITQFAFWNASTPDSPNPNSRHIKQRICQDLSNCVCSMDGSYINVNCEHLENIDKLLHFLKIKYEHSNIGHIYISKSIIHHLPARAFQSLSIQRIFIRRSLVRNVSVDAFQGINGLVELRLDNFNLLTIPSSIGELNNTLRAMWMENGDLRTVQQTLQNCTQLQMLSLKINRIASIHPLAFLRMNNLNKLDLSNNTIKWLDPRTFSSLSQLRYLDLMRNYLESTDGLFDNSQFNIETLILTDNNISDDVTNLTRNPLYSLRFLYLDRNPLKIIKNDSLQKFPGLQKLILNAAQLTLVEPGAFKSMTRLMRVRIASNFLTYLDNETFANMNALQLVDISDNRIETIDGLFQSAPQIRDIYASNNSLRVIHQNCFQNNKYLKSLFMDTNLLSYIQKDTFYNNAQLETLHMRSNKIKYLEPDSFRGLYSLWYLSLAHNLLTSLNNSLSNLPSLKFIDLSYNCLTVLDATCFVNVPNLQTISISRNSLHSVEGAFSHLTNLQTLRLQHNHLETITQDSLFFPGNLKVIQLYDNPLTCNCLLKWLVELIAEKRVTIGKARCIQPEWMHGKRLRHISVEEVTKWPEDCPQNCTCTCFQNFTDYYVGVYCAGLQLTSVPNILPKKTGYLDLSRNEIELSPQPLLNNLTQLEYLFLHENNLTLLPDFSIFKLRTLTLAENLLTTFPVSRVNSDFLEHITLSDNPWLCNCQTLSFHKWLLAKQSIVADVNSTKCDNREVNRNLRNRLIVLLTEALLCPSLIYLYASIIVTVLGFLLFVAGGKIAYNRYRMNIKVWMYSRGVCSCLSCVKEEDLDEDKQFDAFVSYSSLDETFVVRQLVPMLENGDKPYHLCLHYRHFAPGSYVQDNIIQAVQLSKRIILVLSQNFLQSEWCRLEFKSAHHLVLEERLNRLIVIVLGDLPRKEDIDPEINLYLETTTYLRWGEKNFWNKLKYVMPRTPCVVTEEDRIKLLD